MKSFNFFFIFCKLLSFISKVKLNLLRMILKLSFASTNKSGSKTISKNLFKLTKSDPQNRHDVDVNNIMTHFNAIRHIWETTNWVGHSDIVYYYTNIKVFDWGKNFLVYWPGTAKVNNQNYCLNTKPLFFLLENVNNKFWQTLLNFKKSW